MVLVPAGEFPMGIDKAEVQYLCREYPGYGPERYDAERPRRAVWLDEYRIDRFPVTNRQYAPAVAANVVPEPILWSHPRWSHPDAPVIGVGWYEATRVAEWWGLCLPTEAQWERAATWDHHTRRKLRYPWGDEWDPSRTLNAEELLGRRISDRYDWLEAFWRSGVGIARGRIEPVGLRDDVAPCGVRMMCGHVWEWTRDDFGGVGKATAKAVRGGSWADDRGSCRGTYRTWTEPSMWRYGPTDIGFRCVWEPS